MVKNFSFGKEECTLVQVIDLSEKILYDQAKARSEFLSLINATVSHEMRNPINSILNQCSLLADIVYSLTNLLSSLQSKLMKLDQFDSNSLKDEIESIKKKFRFDSTMRKLEKSIKIQTASTKILKFLVNDLLDFARLKSGKFRHEIKRFNIQDSVKEILEIQRFQAETMGIELRTRFTNLELCNFMVTTDE